MIGKGTVLFAVLRDEPSIGGADVLACGFSEAHIASRMVDFSATTTGKRRRVVRVKLVVEEVLEEFEERPVRG